MTNCARLSCNDPSSFSNSHQFTTQSIKLSWMIDFLSKKIKGYAILQLLKKSDDNCTEIILDAKDLDITRISSNDQELSYHLLSSIVEFGSKLIIDISSLQETNSVSLKIEYSTGIDASALHWLDPSQTVGRRLPYVYSQCQAIHARSLLPCQDTPGVKCPYEAQVEVAEEYEVVMSAIKGKIDDPKKNQDGLSTRMHYFKQDVPIPSYLIALACGALVCRDIGPRSKVWCEPECIEAAAWEFAEVEHILCIAESFCGPYVWGCYDLLVLPPSFPYGGMENPCLTFVTPSLLAGDRSLVNVVAHEISHSWTGNLVTNSTWEHFWLNEGHTTYIERLIHSQLEVEKTGHEGDSESRAHHRDLDIMAGLASLKTSLDMCIDHPEYTAMIPDLTGVDPDDVFNSTPYEKGSNLLLRIEILVGQELMLQWLKAYIEKFKKQSISTSDWQDFLFTFMKGKTGNLDLESGLNWNAWYYSLGPLVQSPPLEGKLSIMCDILCEHFVNLHHDADLPVVDDNIYHSFSTPQKIVFFDKLFQASVGNADAPRALEHCLLQSLNEKYALFECKNAEIIYRWLKICLSSKYEPSLPVAFNFLTQFGRMKYVLPLFKALHAWEEKRSQAVDFFGYIESNMHCTTRRKVANILKVS